MVLNLAFLRPKHKGQASGSTPGQPLLPSTFQNFVFRGKNCHSVSSVTALTKKEKTLFFFPKQWQPQSKTWQVFIGGHYFRPREVVKSKILNLGQFLTKLDEIRCKSKATQGALAHQISSWSDEKWQRYGTWSVSQGRRGPSNGVSKMNLFMAGGHSFWPRKLIFGYVVAQCIYPKSYYYLLLIKSSVWPRQGPKDNQSAPKCRVRL